MKHLLVALVVAVFFVAASSAGYAGLPEPGPVRTNTFIQNVGEADATVNVVYTSGQAAGLSRRYQVAGTIPARACKYVLYTQVDGSVTDAWAGAGEVYSSQPLAAIVNMFWDFPSGARTAATYSSQEGPATAAYLPSLAVLDGQLTLITIQNAEQAPAQVTARFYDRNGAEVLIYGFSVAAGAERTISLATLEPDFGDTGGFGSASIASDRAISAIVARHWADASEAYRGATAGDTTIWMPGIFRKWFAGDAWNYDAMEVQNLGEQAAQVHVELINRDGTLQHALDDTIPARGSAEYNTFYQGTLDPARFQALVAALGDNWQGTAKIASTNGQPLAGVCYYYAGSTGIADNLCYSATRDSAMAADAMAFPAVYRKLTGGSDEQWSTALVHNTAAVSGTLALEFYHNSGVKMGDTYRVPIPASGMVRLNMKQGLELPQAALDAVGTNFSGCLYITPSAGVRLAAVNCLYWPNQGRASGYAGIPVP